MNLDHALNDLIWFDIKLQRLGIKKSELVAKYVFFLSKFVSIKFKIISVKTVLYFLWKHSDTNSKFLLDQGCNERKVISEVYASFVLQWILSLGGNVNTRRMLKADTGSILYITKSMKYSGHRKLLCELLKLSKLNAFNLLGY